VFQKPHLKIWQNFPKYLSATSGSRTLCETLAFNHRSQTVRHQVAFPDNLATSSGTGTLR